MNVKSKLIFFNSIRFKLIIGVLIFLVPFLMVLAYNNFYAINVVRDQVATSNKNIVALHLKQIDSNLMQMDQYLADLAGTNTDLPIIESSKDEDKSVLAMVRLKNRISEEILINKSVDAIFIYSVSKELFIYSQNDNNGGFEFENLDNGLINTIKSSARKWDVFSDGWHVVEGNGNYYLLRLLKSGNSYVGAWVKSDRLLVPASDNNLHANSISVFVTDQGEPMGQSNIIYGNSINLDEDFDKYYLAGNKNKFLVVGEKSAEGNFSMVAITPDSNILQGVPYIRSILILIATTTLFLMPIYLLIIRKSVLYPLKRISTVMKNIKKGNLDLRIEPFKTSEEFHLLNETFNDMVDKIHRLKIDIYEEKISRQKEELKHLQLQVNPHFFLNTLNIMNTLARTRNYEILQEMSLCLIQYFRYMFRSNMEFVALEDELFHVKNYIRIQELRFPKSLSSEFIVPDFLMRTPVPPLIIHTFIENTVKHSVTLDDPIHLSVHISIVENENKTGVKIIIKDTGKGFSDEILVKIKAGDKIIDEQGEHIGIRNVQKRLSILYDEMAGFSCRNDEDGGAVVEMILPLGNG